WSSGPPNAARFVFLDPASTDFYLNWQEVAHESVAILRSETGRNPYDPDLAVLIGELSAQSDAFRALWAAHDVRVHDTGVKLLHHHVVGNLSLTFDSLQLSADTRLSMTLYTAEPGSPSEEALNLLRTLESVSAKAALTRGNSAAR